MPIDLITYIKPKNDGTFATHDSQYGKGGWHEVVTMLDRDNIPILRRRAGMACNVLDEGRTFILAADLASWVEIVLTGVEDAPTTGGPYVRQFGDWLPLDVFLDGGIYAP